MNDLENAQPNPEEAEVTTEQIAHPAEVEPIEAQLTAVEPVEIESVEAEPVQAEPVEVAPAAAEPAAVEPVEAPPVETPPVEAPAKPEPAEPEHPMDTDIAAAYAYHKLKPGQILDGIVVSISSMEILIDVGSKSEGVVRGRELEQLDKEFVASLQEGSDVLAYVVRPEDRQGNLVLSLARAQQEQDWREAEQLFEAKETVERKVIGTNRGGLIVEMGRVRGFAPASQLAIEYHDQRPPKAEGAQRWTHLVGKQLLFKIIELDRKRNRLILSERLAMREFRRSQKEQLLQDLHKGDIRKGKVTSLTNFGAFVDLGGADGLIHLSELSWGQVQHPSSVLELGQEVEVYVLKVDRKRRRIGLSLRQLQPEPWAVVHDVYAVGQVVQGTITNVTDFGAFARVGPGIEGLIHISELADHRVAHPRDVVKPGDSHLLRIIRIEPQRRRMALSLKQVSEDEYVEFDWREATGDMEDEEELVQPAMLELEEARAELEAIEEEVPEPVEPEAAAEEAAAEPEAEAAEAEPVAGEAEVEAVEAEAVEAEPAAEEEEAAAEPEPESEAVEAEPVAEETETEANSDEGAEGKDQETE